MGESGGMTMLSMPRSGGMSKMNSGGGTPAELVGDTIGEDIGEDPGEDDLLESRLNRDLFLVGAPATQ